MSVLRKKGGGLFRSFKDGFFLPQAVASCLHGSEIEVAILKTKEECDHVQFLITQTGGEESRVMPPLENGDVDARPQGGCTIKGNR